MTMPVCLLLLAVLPIISADLIKSENLTDFVLGFHNKLRAGEGAADMIELQWSDKLAKEANAWASRCVFKHQMKGRGENLAFDSNRGKTEDKLESSMQSWFDEKRMFSRQMSSCGSTCHYTQMVWAKTTHVGCSAVTCSNLQAFGRYVSNALYLVCFYDPMGNYGTNLYTVGRPCSKCPAGYKQCHERLCKGDGTSGGKGGKAPCIDTNQNCKWWADRNECNKNPRWMKVNCRKSCNTC
ncbi:cysteine-rich secretory protein LCCL domain-containing 2-like [Argonauta hians]